VPSCGVVTGLPIISSFFRIFSPKNNKYDRDILHLVNVSMLWMQEAGSRRDFPGLLSIFGQTESTRSLMSSQAR
jgi:hypothetical protein